MHVLIKIKQKLQLANTQHRTLLTCKRTFRQLFFRRCRWHIWRRWRLCAK